MRIYKVNGREHKVFDPEDTLPDRMIVQANWREGRAGEWVKADDDCVIEILRRGIMKRHKGKKREVAYVGTCTGTFPAYSHSKMDTSRRLNIYSFGGNKVDDILIQRENLSKYEQVFVVYLACGMRPHQAYLKAFPTNDPSYAKFKSAQLVKTTRVRTAMKEELKPVLEELDIDEKLILGNIKEVALSAEKDDTKLKALFKLADIMDLEDKNRTQVTSLSVGAFQGFSEELLDEVERPKELKK